MHRDRTASMCVLTRSMCKSLTLVFRRPPFLFTLLDFKPIIVLQFFSAVQIVSYVNKSTWFHFVCRGIAWTHKIYLPVFVYTMTSFMLKYEGNNFKEQKTKQNKKSMNNKTKSKHLYLGIAYRPI